MSWHLGEHDFEGGPHVAFDEMATMSACIGLADGDVYVDFGLVGFDGHVADQR